METPEVNVRPPSRRWCTPVLAVTGVLLPLVFYWLYWGRVPAVTPAEAKKLLRAADHSAVLIDVRPRQEFNAYHVDGADSWSLPEILGIASSGDIPAPARGKKLLLLCDVGAASRTATLHLQKLGLAEIASVRGGIQAWIADTPGRDGGVFEQWRTASGAALEFPFRPMPRYQQVVVVASAYVVKPMYTLLALALILILWPRTDPDLKALRLGLLFFFLGENFCAMNYLCCDDSSYLFEYLHSYGMLLAFSFITYALLEGFDRRILQLSDPHHKCAALGLCKTCIKYTGASCGLKRTFFLIIPALALVALIPLTAAWQSVSYNTIIFGTFYNYSHPVVHQQMEILYCPLAALALLAASLLVLMFKKENPLGPAKVVFAGGVGCLGFALLRATFFRLPGSDLMWSVFWEEATEWLFIIGVCAILWIFRQGLMLQATRNVPQET